MLQKRWLFKKESLLNKCVIVCKIFCFFVYFKKYRFWRKNRKPNAGSSCVGTDLNRNSGFKWMTGGSSSSPCSDVFAGPAANSELEIKAVQNALNAKLGNWDAYLTLHTYGQWLFTYIFLNFIIFLYILIINF